MLQEKERVALDMAAAAAAGPIDLFGRRLPPSTDDSEVVVFFRVTPRQHAGQVWLGIVPRTRRVALIPAGGACRRSCDL